MDVTKPTTPLLAVRHESGLEKGVKRYGGLLLVLMVILALGHALPSYFIVDAPSAIRDNPRVNGQATWSSLWLSNYWGEKYHDRMYRPLTLSLWRVLFTGLHFGDKASWYGGVNLLLHGMATLLLWRLASAVLSSELGGWVAAAWFALHPLVTEVVPNLVGTADVLATLFVLAGLLLWRRGDRGGYVAAAVCWAAGLLSKESAIVMPGALIGLAFIDRRMRGSVFSWSVLLSVGVAWWVWRCAVVYPVGPSMTNGGINPLVVAPQGVRLLTGWTLLGSYLAQALVPWKLSADYSFNQYPLVRSWTDVRWLATTAAALAVVLLMVRTWRRDPSARPVTLGVVLFVAMLFPLSNMVMLIGTIRADRLVYLSLTAMALTIGSSFVLLHRARPRCAVVLLLGVLMTFGVATGRRATVWSDPKLFWPQALRDAPNSTKVLSVAAQLKLGLNPATTQEAIGLAQRAVEIARALPEDEMLLPWLALARAYIDMAMLTQEPKWYAAALASLEEARLRDQSATRQRRLFEQWQEPNRPEVEYGSVALHVERGKALRGLGRLDEARAELHRATWMMLRDGIAPYELAQVYDKLGDEAATDRWLREAVRREPTTPPMLAGLAHWEMRHERYEQAVSLFERAMRHHDISPETWQATKRAYEGWISQALAAGDTARATELARQAVERHGFHTLGTAPLAAVP